MSLHDLALKADTRAQRLSAGSTLDQQGTPKERPAQLPDITARGAFIMSCTSETGGSRSTGVTSASVSLAPQVATPGKVGPTWAGILSLRKEPGGEAEAQPAMLRPWLPDS